MSSEQAASYFTALLEPTRNSEMKCQAVKTLISGGQVLSTWQAAAVPARSKQRRRPRNLVNC